MSLVVKRWWNVGETSPRSRNLCKTAGLCKACWLSRAGTHGRSGWIRRSTNRRTNHGRSVMAAMPFRFRASHMVLVCVGHMALPFLFSEVSLIQFSNRNPQSFPYFTAFQSVRVSMLRDAAWCCVMLRDAAWCRDAACGVPKSCKWGQVMWIDDWYDWWWLMVIDDDWWWLMIIDDDWWWLMWWVFLQPVTKGTWGIADLTDLFLT